MKVRNIGRYGTGWKIVISDGYVSYRYDLSDVDGRHCINSLSEILIKASKRKFKKSHQLNHKD